MPSITNLPLLFTVIFPEKVLSVLNLAIAVLVLVILPVPDIAPSKLI